MAELMIGSSLQEGRLSGAKPSVEVPPPKPSRRRGGEFKLRPYPNVSASSGSVEPEGVGEEIVLEGLRDLAPALRRGDRSLPPIGHRAGAGEQHPHIEWLRLLEKHLEVDPPGWADG